MLRIDKYSKKKLFEALRVFDGAEVIFFGSRMLENKKGGNVDIAINGLSKKEFKEKKIKFLKVLLVNDFMLPVDVVRYEDVGELLKKEIKVYENKV